MKTLLALAAGTVGFGDASAQGGPMMNGGMDGYGWMGGFGGYWVPVLLVIVVGLVVFILLQRRK